MDRIALIISLVGLSLVPGDKNILEPYDRIPAQEVFSKLITRSQDDPIISGCIHSRKGLERFYLKYPVGPQLKDIDFTKQMIVFGVTDAISTCAFQLIRDKRSRGYCLDYCDSGVEYSLEVPPKGSKYSYLQLFLVDGSEKPGTLRIKNYVSNGTSKVFK